MEVEQALADPLIEAVIADPEALRYEQRTLSADGRSVDLVYNRLVDFALEQPGHEGVRAAYVDGAVVVTPSPRNHALFADKRNFTLLSDAALLREWGLERPHLEALSGIPSTMRVSGENADVLWANRARYFFKPSSGYGSKAVYRGDKLTKRVWSEILGADYVAQEFAAPSERTIRLGEETLQRRSTCGSISMTASSSCPPRVSIRGRRRTFARQAADLRRCSSSEFIRVLRISTTRPRSVSAPDKLFGPVGRAARDFDLQ